MRGEMFWADEQETDEWWFGDYDRSDTNNNDDGAFERDIEDDPKDEQVGCWIPNRPMCGLASTFQSSESWCF